MATVTSIRIRPRPAHTAGPTYLAYSPDGTKLVTVGSNNTTRVYKTGSDGEPANIDGCQEENLAVAATDSFFLAGAEDGTVSKYNFDGLNLDSILLRSSLPVRSVAISSDGTWCAVSSDELTVKLVRVQDPNKIHYLKDAERPIKHVAFDGDSKHLALSGTDGHVYIYTISEDGPLLLKKLPDVIPRLETDDERTSAVAWHPDGRAFATPTADRQIQVISMGDWENQRAFNDGHSGDITALAWSPNGAMLASAGKDRKVNLWETRTQKIVTSYNYSNVLALAWHPTKNLLSFTSSDGEVYIHDDFVPNDYAHIIKFSRQAAPFIHDPLLEISANVRRPQANGNGKDIADRRRRRPSQDSLDDLLGAAMEDEDDFVVDDDGAGYAMGTNGNGKRTREDDGVGAPLGKRHQSSWEPQYHESFQPGSTPWRGNRKYLCLNLVGFVWTIDQDSHNTVTVEFYDTEYLRDFHFTDTRLYDKACLNETGTLLSCPAKGDTPATLFYRPHETWTSRSDWHVELPKDEDITAIALSESFITVTTTANYVRIYTLFGIPYRIFRQKSSPVVSCASWRDYVLTLGNGAVGADGTTQLLYTIQNVKRDEVCQNEDIVALPAGESVESVFFSDKGDPFIYDSTGTLLTLLNWRTPFQATWVPLLDTKLLSRLASGRKTETYYPVAVADNKFHCIILKGGDRYPYFPRPLLSEFDFEVPLTSKAVYNREGPSTEAHDDMIEDGSDGNAPTEMQRLEAELALRSVLAAQKQHLVHNTHASHADQTDLARMDMDIDKTLLRLLMAECIEGEERGMRALEAVMLMRDRSGRMIEAAGKVADKYGRTVLGEKIRELGEARLLEVED